MRESSCGEMSAYGHGVSARKNAMSGAYHFASSTVFRIDATVSSGVPSTNEVSETIPWALMRSIARFDSATLMSFRYRSSVDCDTDSTPTYTCETPAARYLG